jgi:hypothetical protein
MKFADFKIKVKIPKMIAVSIEATKGEIIKYNQDDQLQSGIDSRGEKIETISAKEQSSRYPYALVTVGIRAAQGLQVDKVDLKFHGDFYKTFKVKVTDKQTEVMAQFIKGADSDIRDNFDSSYDFLGLTEDNLEGYTWQDLFPVFTENLQKSIIK